MGVTREQQDNFALRSHHSWSKACNSKRFDCEIVPIKLADGSDFFTDELPRPSLTTDKIAKLKPVFKLPTVSENDVTKSHTLTVTAGNCSGINDGAAAVILVSSSLKEKLPDSVGLARIVSWAQSAGKPELMGIEVVNAVNKAVSNIFC